MIILFVNHIIKSYNFRFICVFFKDFFSTSLSLFNYLFNIKRSVVFVFKTFIHHLKSCIVVVLFSCFKHIFLFSNDVVTLLF